MTLDWKMARRQLIPGTAEGEILRRAQDFAGRGQVGR